MRRVRKPPVAIRPVRVDDRNIHPDAAVTTGPATRRSSRWQPTMASKTTLEYYKELLEKNQLR